MIMFLKSIWNHRPATVMIGFVDFPSGNKRLWRKVAMDIRGKSFTSGSCSMARFNYQRVREKTRGFVHFGDKDRDTSRKLFLQFWHGCSSQIHSGCVLPMWGCPFFLDKSAKNHCFIIIFPIKIAIVGYTSFLHISHNAIDRMELNWSRIELN